MLTLINQTFSHDTLFQAISGMSLKASEPAGGPVRIQSELYNGGWGGWGRFSKNPKHFPHSSLPFSGQISGFMSITMMSFGNIYLICIDITTYPTAKRPQQVSLQVLDLHIKVHTHFLPQSIVRAAGSQESFWK